MHIVSDQLMDAYEEKHASGFPKRFHEWWQAMVDPKADANYTERLVFAHRDEFGTVGVDEDEEQFMFLYARALMPEMGDRDYLETMDVIFAPQPEIERMKALKAIAAKYAHRG